MEQVSETCRIGLGFGGSVLPCRLVFGPNGDRPDVSSWKSGAPPGTLCIVACLARMIAVDAPHHVAHARPRSTSSVQPSEQKPPETSRLSPVSPGFRSAALVPHATFVKQVRPGLLAECQFPDALAGANGVFHKPSAW